VLHTGAMGVGKEGYCSGSRGLHVQWKHLLQRMSVQRQGKFPAMRPPINATGRTGRPVVSVWHKRRPCLQQEADA